MTRFIKAMFILCLFATVAEARPKQTHTAPQALTYCASDGTYRQTCGQADKRLQRHPNGVGQAVVTGGLVGRARHYLGTNPTGRRSLWCGAFMALIAPEAASRVRNPNQARDWATLPHVSAQVGAIAVMSRGKKGGHVGVVTGFDANGNPIVVSGNHNNTVGEGVYPRSRVIAYVGAS